MTQDRSSSSKHKGMIDPSRPFAMLVRAACFLATFGLAVLTGPMLRRILAELAPLPSGVLKLFLIVLGTFSIVAAFVHLVVGLGGLLADYEERRSRH